MCEEREGEDAGERDALYHGTSLTRAGFACAGDIGRHFSRCKMDTRVTPMPISNENPES